MTNIYKVMGIAGLFSLLLTACGSAGTTTPRSAYERACRSVYMKPAAARQAYWCWESVGANSYDEWQAFESASLAADPPAADGIARHDALRGVATR